MRDLLTRFAVDDDGATAMEYALIASLFAIACIAAYTHLGHAMSSKYDFIATAVTTAGS